MIRAIKNEIINFLEHYALVKFFVSPSHLIHLAINSG